MLTRAVEYSLPNPKYWTGSLELELLGLLPREALVSTEVAVLGRLAVDGLGQVKLLNDDTGSEVEVVPNDLDELLRRLLRSAVRVDVDGKGLSNTNSVRELDESTSAETGVDQRLGNPSADVGGRSIDLGEILAGEGTTTVGTPATVRVNDDLAAGQTGITLGTTNDKETRRLDLSMLIKDCVSVRKNLRGRWSYRRGTARG